MKNFIGLVMINIGGHLSQRGFLMLRGDMQRRVSESMVRQLKDSGVILARMARVPAGEPVTAMLAVCRVFNCCDYSPPGPRRPHGMSAGMD